MFNGQRIEVRPHVSIGACYFPNAEAVVSLKDVVFATRLVTFGDEIAFTNEAKAFAPKGGSIDFWTRANLGSYKESEGYRLQDVYTMIRKAASARSRELASKVQAFDWDGLAERIYQGYCTQETEKIQQLDREIAKRVNRKRKIEEDLTQTKPERVVKQRRV